VQSHGSFFVLANILQVNLFATHIRRQTVALRHATVGLGRISVNA
jgi:hypothetical protein